MQDLWTYLGAGTQDTIYKEILLLAQVSSSVSSENTTTLQVSRDLGDSKVRPGQAGDFLLQKLPEKKKG